MQLTLFRVSVLYCFCHLAIFSPVSQAQLKGLDPTVILKSKDKHGSIQDQAIVKKFFELFQIEPVAQNRIEERLWELRDRQGIDGFLNSMQRKNKDARLPLSTAASGHYENFMVQEIDSYWLLFHPDFQDGLRAEDLSKARVFIYRSYEMIESIVGKKEKTHWKPEVGIEVRIPIRKQENTWAIFLYSPWKYNEPEKSAERYMRFQDAVIQNRWKHLNRKGIIYLPTSTGIPSELKNNMPTPQIFHPSNMIGSALFSPEMDVYLQPDYIGAPEGGSLTQEEETQKHYFLKRSGQYTYLDSDLLWKNLFDPTSTSAKKTLSLAINTTMMALDKNLPQIPEWFLARMLTHFKSYFPFNSLKEFDVDENFYEPITIFLTNAALRSESKTTRRKAQRLLLNEFGGSIYDRTATMLLSNGLDLFLVTNPEELIEFRHASNGFLVNIYPDSKEAFEFIQEYIEKSVKHPGTNVTGVNLELGLYNILTTDPEDRHDVFHIIAGLRFYIDIMKRDKSWYRKHFDAINNTSYAQRALVSLASDEKQEIFLEAMGNEPFHNESYDEEFAEEFDPTKESQRIVNRMQELALKALSLTGIKDSLAKRDATIEMQNPKFRDWMDKNATNLAAELRKNDLRKGNCQNDAFGSGL